MAHPAGSVVAYGLEGEPAQGGGRRRRLGGRRRLLQRELQPERAPRAGLARDLDLAAHELRQLPADGEPEARAAVAARRAAVGLREALEAGRLPLGWNP